MFYWGGSYDVHGQFTARPDDNVVMLLLWCATVHDYITKPSARPEDDLFIYLALPTRAGSPQQHMPITVGPFCLTHPVNFPCGRKPEYAEETHDFRQSVDFYSFHVRTGFESHWESSHWDLNLRPQRWKASALTTWPLKPLYQPCCYYLLFSTRVTTYSADISLHVCNYLLRKL
jgi:hypothetical protein